MPKRHEKRLSPQKFPSRSSTGTRSKKISVLACKLRTVLGVMETSTAAELPLRGHEVMSPNDARLESILLLARGAGSSRYSTVFRVVPGDGGGLPGTRGRGAPGTLPFPALPGTQESKGGRRGGRPWGLYRLGTLPFWELLHWEGA